MKKAFLTLGLAVAALTLTNCNKQESDVPGLDGFKARINLVTEDTKTANDGMNTVWAEGDALSVWVANGSEYGANVKFDVDAETGTATGTIDELPSSTNDWYAFYPYNKNLVSPTAKNAEGQSKGYMTVGSSASGVQTQNGNDSKAHLAGSNLPLFGIARSVSGNPSIVMKQVCGVIAVNVTNATNEPITVQSVKFVANEDIVGTYFIDFSTGEPAFEGSGDSYVSATASLSVSGADAIAAGGSAKFFLAVKPFTGNVVSITVVTDKGEVEKAASTSVVPIEVAAGHIKTVNFTFEAPEATEYTSLEEAIAAADNTELNTADALVVAKANQGLLLMEDNAYLLVYDKNSTVIANTNVGDIISVAGKMATYKEMRQIVPSAVTVRSSGNSVSNPNPTDITEGFDNFTSSEVIPVSFTGALSISGNYYNVTVSGASEKVGSILKPADADKADIDALNGSNVVVTGYYIYTSGKYVYAIATSVEKAAGGQTVTLASIEVSNAKTSYTVGDQFVKPTVTAYYSDQSSKDVTASATFSGYDLTKAGSYTVEVSYTEGNVTKTTSYGITVSAGGSQGEGDLHTITMADYASVSFTAGAYTITAEKGDATNAPAYNATGKDLRVYAKGLITISNSKENITKIVFNLSAQGLKRLAPVTASTGTIATQASGDNTVTWTGNASSVTFTVGEKADFGSDGDTKAGQLCFASIDVAPWSDGDVQAKTLESISVSGQKASFNVGDAFAFGGTVTANYSDGSHKNVTEEADFSSPDMNSAGEKTVTVSYTESGVTKTCDYTITVSAVNDNAFVFDFTITGDDARAEYGLNAWDTAENHDESTRNYLLNNTNYSFILGPYTFLNTGYLFLKAKGGDAYLGLPAISGKKLVQVVITAPGAASASAKATISSDADGQQIVTGGEVQTLTKGGKTTFDLSGTSANTVYYIKASDSGFNDQISKLELVYE